MMMDIQADTIPSLGFSMAMNGDVITVDRGMFDEYPDMSLSLSGAAAETKPTLKRTAAKKATTAKHPKKQRVSRPRRVDPKNKQYIPEAEPTDSDVVLGRGGRSNNHPGNKACWGAILARRAAYKTCETDAQKNEIAQQVVDFVQGRNGRYVKFEKETGRWFIALPKTALDKAKQGLRDKYVPEDKTGAKKSVPKKKPALKKQSKTTPKKPTTTTKHDQATNDNKPTDLDRLRKPISASFDSSDGVDSLKLSSGHSLDIFPIMNLSESLVGSSLYGGMGKLLQSNDSIMQNWDISSIEDQNQHDNYWNAKFLSDIGPMIDFEAV